MLLPVQYSAGSHCPVDARHWVVLGFGALAGQVAVVPVQAAPASQTSDGALHWVPAFPGVPTQRPFPSHASVVVQTFPSLQDAPRAEDKFTGQTMLLPVQYSAGSH